MAASPQFKVYDSQGIYQAACKEIEAAACLVSLYGEGATIRDRHGPVLFTEGVDQNEGYDQVAALVLSRI